MGPSLLKIQYTELKLSCRNDPVVKNYIYSNSDLDLWPNDPKINRVLPLPHGNHVVKIDKDPIYRTKVIVQETTLLSKILFIVMVTLTFDLMTPKEIGFFPFHRAIVWSSLVKIQYTEPKLSCGNDPVVKNSIYSNGDLDLWPNDFLAKWDIHNIHIKVWYNGFFILKNIFYKDRCEA